MHYNVMCYAYLDWNPFISLYIGCIALFLSIGNYMFQKNRIFKNIFDFLSLLAYHQNIMQLLTKILVFVRYDVKFTSSSNP
jgi:hypothetical protein